MVILVIDRERKIIIFRCCFIEVLLAGIFSAALTMFLNKKRWQNKKRLEMQNRYADF